MSPVQGHGAMTYQRADLSHRGSRAWEIRARMGRGGEGATRDMARRVKELFSRDGAPFMGYLPRSPYGVAAGPRGRDVLRRNKKRTATVGVGVARETSGPKMAAILPVHGRAGREVPPTEESSRAAVRAARAEAPIRVIVAGGSPLYQVAMFTLLRDDPRVKLLAQVRGTGEAVGQARELGCDVLVLYAEFPHVDAAMAADRLRPGHATTRLLMLTETDSRDELLATLHAGARGYGILRNLDPEDLRTGILTLSRTGAWTCPISTAHLVGLISQRPFVRPLPLTNVPSLSEREVAVLRMLASGHKERNIAEALCLSPNTVKTYLRRICEKFDVSTRSDAIRLGIQSGVIPDRRAYSV